METTRVVLNRRPVGEIDEDHFTIDRGPVPDLGPRDVLVRNIFVSCDPYLRGRMEPGGGIEPGDVVPVRAVGEVVQSGHPDFGEGDLVWGFLAWELHTVVPGGAGLRKIDPAYGPISNFISVLGMPGLTAEVGMLDIGRVRPGDTVLVSAAAGAVGSVAGQLARLAGATVVGSAGSDRKVDHVVQTLGFDAAFNHRTAASLDGALSTHCPDGIDVYFDNVGGPLLDAVLGHLRPGARIPVCGMISHYEQEMQLNNLLGILRARATMTGFSIYDHVHRLDAFIPRMSARLKSGAITYHEDIHEGIESVPSAFVGMLRGDNVGKRLVKVG